MKQFNTRLVSFMAILGMVVGLMPAGAAGVDITASPTSIDSASDTTTDVTFSWTSSANYQTNDTVQFTFDHAPDAGTSLAACDTPTTAIAGGNVSLGSLSTTSATFTFSTDATGSNASACLKVPTLGTDQDTYSVSMQTTGSVNDVGAVLLYVNGDNDVTVTATVPATLSFAIRNSSDDADTHTCDLGVLSQGATHTCEYRLEIGTNAANGFTATIQGDDDFFNSTANATMTNIADNASFANGTEAYGISAVTPASTGGYNSATGNYDQAAVAGGDSGYTFNNGTTPVPTTTAKTIVSYSAAFDGGVGSDNVTNKTTLVTHRADISSITPAGSYQQVVTYLVTGDF